MKIYTFEEIELMKEGTEFITVTTNQRVRMKDGLLQVHSITGEWIFCIRSRRWLLEGYKLLH
ncbi:hypothetical protein [Clostridium sardiniense]|uniref:hypothetical protein n=1 Tax=Clostridium sardiniense TaxID=29369 RepID=UPI00195DA76B|nr:hypothetical protein [Clostridium sardiniense]MBM7836468.1 hypothetical protein [Clostridium sardiniense]